MKWSAPDGSEQDRFTLTTCATRIGAITVSHQKTFLSEAYGVEGEFGTGTLRNSQKNVGKLQYPHQAEDVQLTG